jgi:hypothetical protein
MSIAGNLQIRFFDLIIERFERKSDAVQAIGDVLNLGLDPVYRRLRGSTPLSTEDVTKLVRAFHISLDNLILGGTDSVQFSFNILNQPVKNFEDYINSIHEDTLMASRLPSVKVYYAAADIPFFYCVLAPELAQFKLYTWGRTVWNFPYLNDRKFDFDLIPTPFMDKLKEVTKMYMHFDSIELWNVNIADNTLGQIEYLLQIGGFKDPNDALILCNKLQEVLQKLRKMAETGQKFLVNPAAPTATFTLSHNEMISTSNTIFVSSPSTKILFSTLAVPNFIRTTNKQLCDYKQNWFDTVLGKSTPLILSAEKNRDWFFNKLNSKIEIVKRRIQVVLEEG